VVETLGAAMVLLWDMLWSNYLPEFRSNGTSGTHSQKETGTMNNLNAIGLDSGKAQQLADKLNDLLANYSIFYQNTRGLHWNIKGEKFFELHLKFEELYNDLLLKIDEIAERILTLGQTPMHNYSDYRKVSRIGESVQISDGLEGVAHILQAFQTVIMLQRELLVVSNEAGDEGTNAMMSDYIRAQEKLVWMYSSFLTA
jgi:starvation-inducible DNA-binding protein